LTTAASTAPAAVSNFFSSTLAFSFHLNHLLTNKGKLCLS